MRMNGWERKRRIPGVHPLVAVSKLDQRHDTNFNRSTVSLTFTRAEIATCKGHPFCDVHYVRYPFTKTENR
jgi:hypothetical protein